MSLIKSSILLASTLAVAYTQDNPIKVASADYIGARQSDNTQSIRDLGWVGQVGDIWITTFGDGVGCTRAATQENCGCAYITSRDGGGVVGDDPLSYHDSKVRTDLCSGVPQMDYFCPKVGDEDDSAGYGLTNVAEVNSTHGILVTRPTFNGGNGDSPGAGIAVVDVSSGAPVCTRPFGVNSWPAAEPDWGQTSLLVDQGYIYSYTGVGDFGPVLARVEQAQAFDVDAWQYYHGNGLFTDDRIQEADINADSPEILGGDWSYDKLHQGQVFYSGYYKKYVLLNTFPATFITARTADNPWGPWSETVNLYSAENVESLVYAPTIIGKFTSEDEKEIYVSYTNSNQLDTVKITFE